MAKVKSLYVDAIFSGVSQCNLSIIKSVLLIILVSVKVLIRDGHTHWVMDIQPYPIQLFWVIPSS